MGLSWSAMRKILEQENLCQPLQGRIRYFATRYRKSHDGEGRVAVLLDGEEIFKSDFFDWDAKRHQAWREIDEAAGRCTSAFESAQAMEQGALDKGGFDQFEFYNAFHQYHNQSIDKSLASQNPVVRLFAILDKRTGKRRLPALAAELAAQPAWLQPFYLLRFEADGFSPPKQ